MFRSFSSVLPQASVPGSWPENDEIAVAERGREQADLPKQDGAAQRPPVRNTPLSQRNASTLEWMRRRLDGALASVRTDAASTADTAQAGNRAKVAALFERSEKAIDEINRLVTGSTLMAPDIARRKHEELSALLNAIESLAQSIDPDTPLPRPSQTCSPAGHAPHDVPGTMLVDQCLDILNALPCLRRAMEWSQLPVDKSTLQCQITLDENYQLSPQEIETMLTHAAFAHTLYADEIDSNLAQADALLGRALPEAWASMPMPDDVKAEFERICPRLQHLPDGRFCDPDSGLVGQIFSNPDNKEIALAFGGTTAGEQKGTLLERQLGNPRITLRQWRANISSATGITLSGGPVPDSYGRAAQLARLLQQSPAAGGSGWTISLTGHSKGGAEAEYAALKTGLPAICFCAPELGLSVLAHASAEELEAGIRNIRHYFVEDDPTPYIGSIFAPLLGRRQAHVGTTCTVKPDSEACTGWLRRLWCHDLFYASMLREAERQLE